MTARRSHPFSLPRLPRAAGVALALALAGLGTGLASRPTVAHAGPAVERSVMPSGLRLAVSRQPTVPIVAINCLVDGGARVDPAGKEGLASLTAELLARGTRHRSALQIAETIERLGGSFETDAGDDWISVSAASLARDVDTAAELVGQSLGAPSFPADELERARAEVLGDLESSEDQPGVLAARAFRGAVFGKGPYGHEVDGSPAAVRGLRREDLVAFHAREMRPERTVCVVVGDVEPVAIRALLERELGAWRAAGSPSPEPTPAAPPPARRVDVDKPLTQANVVLGGVGLPRSSPDWFPTLVMNHILGGGGFTSRLVRAIRVEAGLAYSVQSGFGSNRLPGPFQIVLQTKVDSTARAVELARREVERMRAEGVTAGELAEAQDYLTGSFPLRLDSSAKLAGLLAQVEYFGLGADYVDRYGERVRAVTVEDVKRAAVDHLHPEQFVEVVVGPAAPASPSSGSPAPSPAGAASRAAASPAPASPAPAAPAATTQAAASPGAAPADGTRP